MIWPLISLKKAISISAEKLNSGYLISTVMSGQSGFQEFPFALLGGSDDLKKQNIFQASTIMKLFTFHIFLGGEFTILYI